MKILINATVSPATKAGLGVYARNLTDCLTQDTAGDEYVVLAQDDDPEFGFSGRANVRVVKVPARLFRMLPFRFMLEQVCLPWMLWRWGVDVVHSLHYALPLVTFGTRRVVTFHDMTFFDMPEMHERFKVFYFQNFMKASMRLADAVIFVSQSSRNDCLTRLGKPHGETAVASLGKSKAFGQAFSVERLTEVRGTYGVGERFILYVGTIEPRKNLTRLVEAFARIAPEYPDLQLVLAGAKGWLTEELFRTLHEVGLGSRVILPGFIAEADKPVLLAACTLFVYPSLYEGFGLPVLEAMASGAAVITSNISSLPEVAGNAAVLIDPRSTDALTAAMDELLRSAERRAELQRRGPQQAAQFTWERTAAVTRAVYAAVCSAKQRGAKQRGVRTN